MAHALTIVAGATVSTRLTQETRDPIFASTMHKHRTTTVNKPHGKLRKFEFLKDDGPSDN